MEAGSALQPVWEWCLRHLGVTGVASPAFLLTSVVAGVYLPGILFSFVDVVLTKRQTLAQEHDLHHARREPRNISAMLSVCDRMFGTFEKAR